MLANKIGTIQDGGKAVELFGVKAEDGRWVASRQKDGGGLRDIDDIPSQTTFGKVKEATAQHFAAAKYAFARDQPNVVHPEPSTSEEPAADIPDTDTITNEELAEVTPDTEKSEAEMIRDYVAENPDVANKDVVASFAEAGVEITSSQVSAARRQLKESE